MDSLTTMWVEQNRCPSHQLILLTQGPICEILGNNSSAFGGGWRTQFFWVGHFEFFFPKKTKKICFKSIQISQSLWETKDGTKFWRLPWFPEKSWGGIKLWDTLYFDINYSYLFRRSKSPLCYFANKFRIWRGDQSFENYGSPTQFRAQ